MDSAATWALGIKTAIAGATGVFVVMVFLQISMAITSRVIKAIETKSKASTSNVITEQSQ